MGIVHFVKFMTPVRIFLLVTLLGSPFTSHANPFPERLHDFIDSRRRASTNTGYDLVQSSTRRDIRSTEVPAILDFLSRRDYSAYPTVLRDDILEVLNQCELSFIAARNDVPAFLTVRHQARFSNLPEPRYYPVYLGPESFASILDFFYSHLSLEILKKLENGRLGAFRSKIDDALSRLHTLASAHPSVAQTLQTDGSLSSLDASLKVLKRLSAALKVITPSIAYDYLVNEARSGLSAVKGLDQMRSIPPGLLNGFIETIEGITTSTSGADPSQIRKNLIYAANEIVFRMLFHADKNGAWIPNHESLVNSALGVPPNQWIELSDNTVNLKGSIDSFSPALAEWAVLQLDRAFRNSSPTVHKVLARYDLKVDLKTYSAHIAKVYGPYIAEYLSSFEMNRVILSLFRMHVGSSGSIEMDLTRLAEIDLLRTLRNPEAFYENFFSLVGDPGAHRRLSTPELVKIIDFLYESGDSLTRFHLANAIWQSNFSNPSSMLFRERPQSPLRQKDVIAYMRLMDDAQHRVSDLTKFVETLKEKGLERPEMIDAVRGAMTTLFAEGGTRYTIKGADPVHCRILLN